MAKTVADLQTDRDRILDKLSEPKSVSHGDKRMENQDVPSLRAALALIDDEINRLGGAPGSRKPVRQIQVRSHKDL